MSDRRFNSLTIQTPEGVRFEHQLASPVVRFIALFIDLAVITTLMSILSVVIAMMGWISLDLAMAFYILLYFVLSIGYFIFLEMLQRGQTIGKRMMQLRVMDAHGLKIRPSQYILRNLLRFVDGFPVLYFLGGLCAILSPRSQRLGDIAAGTVVVRIPESRLPSLGGLMDNMYNSFRDYPRLEALLRQRVLPEQAEVALQALRRRDEMDAVPRAKLFADLAGYYRELVVFPDELVRSISDEQYVRNCVDTIYRGVK
ncbi:RDD family protein [Coraliomargarita parva]|uniref:RDD family protein n=1 Tax=Coraliomargarita parva TaxID=3014050 RepID=UPI0022B45F14|nr:RDD family protein [Coraliomargarita parva]